MTRLFSFLFMLYCYSGMGQKEVQSPIIFIYDASGSMWGQIKGETKMKLASSSLLEVVKELNVNQKIGLVAYGHRKKGDCEDVEILVDLDNRDKSLLEQTLKGIEPLGKTPLAYSATLVTQKLKTSGEKATIILITDGIESCDGDLCAVIKNAHKSGIDFKLHIVGFGIKENEKKPLECAAEAGGGKYFDASDKGELMAVLDRATKATIDDPPSNMRLYALINEEPIDAYAKIYQNNTFINSLRTYRDTGEIYLPDGNYTMHVEALENTDLQPFVKAFQVIRGQLYFHIVSFDAGILEVNTFSNGEKWDAIVKIKDPKTDKTIASTRTYGSNKTVQVPPGNYIISFQALNIKGETVLFVQENVAISSNQTTSISHDFPAGRAFIGVKAGEELVDATVNFKSISTNNAVDGSRTYTSPSTNPKEFILSPGKYTVSIQSLGVHKGYKHSFEIEVLQGEVVRKIIQIK